MLRSFGPCRDPVIGEDAVLWPPVQQGLEASDHRGVLSAREERVYAFQRFVVERVGSGEPCGPS